MTVNLKKTIDLISEAQQLQWAMAFTAVVEEGSFSRAGERLGLPKSTVSRRLAALEAQMRADPLAARCCRLIRHHATFFPLFFRIRDMIRSCVASALESSPTIRPSFIT